MVMEPMEEMPLMDNLEIAMDVSGLGAQELVFREVQVVLEQEELPQEQMEQPLMVAVAEKVETEAKKVIIVVKLDSKAVA